MFNMGSKSDVDVKTDVMNELMWDVSLDSTSINVKAHNGLVTLTGTVPHYTEKISAEHAAQRVSGVKAVADELEVKGLFDKSDEEIAKAAMSALKWNYSVPSDIKVTVEKGWVTLTGETEWNFQKNAAMESVQSLLGVCGTTNSITLKTKTQPFDIKLRIEKALKRTAENDSRKIDVSVDGDKVTLSGSVHSYSVIEDARMAAWNAPGIVSVENNLVISQ